MVEEKIIKGNTEEEVWQQLTDDLNSGDILEYRALIVQAGKQVILDIDIDLGGGFEGGYATTTLTAPLPAQDFRFAIHKQHLIDEAAKLFGMQDIVVGYPDFDKSFIIKSNNEIKTKEIFADNAVRQELQSINDVTLRVMEKDIADSGDHLVVLQLNIEEGITDPYELRRIYHPFFTILLIIDPINANEPR